MAKIVLLLRNVYLVSTFFILALLIREGHSAFVISCAANADCDYNAPRSSSTCDFSSDVIYDRQTCSIGACTCNSGYVPTSDGCSLIQNLTIGAPCARSPAERYPFGAYCRTNTSANTVTCLENMQYAPTATPPGCKYILPVRTFGDTCNTTINWCDSTVGLQCSKLSGKCSCADSNAIWRDDKCTLDRIYGDACQKDADCSPPAGSSFLGLVCDTGRCVCKTGFVARVLAMKMPPVPAGASGPPTIQYRLMCLNDTISAPSEPGQPCHVAPDSQAAAAGVSPFSPIRYCWHDAICHRCPGDPSSLANSLIGKCYKLTNPPPVPDSILDIFWLYFTSSTVTSPATRPTEPSTVSQRAPVTPIAPRGNGNWNGKFGDNCWSDSDCHEAAFCLIDLVNAINPPCSAAICVCRHGNEPDTNGTCRPIRHLLVGDKCTNPIFEILPPGTACENGKVVCDSPKFVLDPNYDTQCVLAITILTFAQICTVGDTKAECDSAAGLDCLPPAGADPWREGPDSATRCWCSIGMWDGAACQVSDYGEVCRVNTDCRGYPLAGVTCNRGLCVCQAGFRPFRTLQLILMQRESLGPGGAMANALGAATLYRQTVCVNENTTLISSLSGSCSALIDPRSGAHLCRDGLFCFRCPTTGDTTVRQTAAVLSSGNCRTLNLLSATGLDMFGRSNEDPYVMRGSDIIESDTVGRPCTQDSECSLYQQCSKSVKLALPTFYNSTYDCQQGFCVCNNGYGLDTNQLCRPFVTVKLGQWCSLTATNTMYPANAGCYFGRVECNYPYVAKNGTCQINFGTRLREFSQTCTDPRDICRMPLVCQANDDYDDDILRCSCADYADIYDSSLGTCRHRQYGDPCKNDTECDNGGYAAFGHGVCSKPSRQTVGTCGCRSSKSYAVEVTRWNSTSRARTTATICLDNIVSRNTRSGILGMCSLRLVQSRVSTPISIVDQGGLCQPGLLCHQCPDDRDKISTSYGLCRPLK